MRLIGTVDAGFVPGATQAHELFGIVGCLYPEAIVRIIDDRYLVDVLDPICAVISRNDETKGVAIENWQVRTVHGVG